MHTAQVSGCAVSTAAQQVMAYKMRGYTGIIITDHFINGCTRCPERLPWKKKMKHLASGFDAAKREGDKCGLDVYFGWEYTFRGSDFLTYGLNLEFLLAHPGLDRLSIEDYSALVRKNGGYIAQAHPFRDDWYIEHKFPVEPRLLDGIEVYNASMPNKTNAKALDFAKLHSLPMQAGSDSHSSNNHFSSGIKLSKRAKSIFEIIEAIKANEAALIFP